MHRIIILILALPLAAEDIVYPPESGVVDVKAQYSAKGDGVADDTAAITTAIAENKGKNRILWFANGTYLVKAQLNVGTKEHSADRFITFQGQSQAGTVIRLADSCPGFQDAAKPQPVLSLFNNPGDGTGDAMHNYVKNLTVDVGRGNPGASGIRFLTNNTGGMYQVTVRSSDPERRGAVGLDLSQHQFGPGLMQRITVVGFDRGVSTGSSFNLVLEHLTLEGQLRTGFHNSGGTTTIRGLTSRNRVPAVLNEKGSMTLIEARLTGGATSAAAIVNRSSELYLRDITQEGYGHLMERKDKTFFDGAKLEEDWEGKGLSLFGARPASLRLPIEDTPQIPWEADLTKWEIIDWTAEDDSEAVQQAFDRAAAQGKTTVCFRKPRGEAIKSKEKPEGYVWGQDERFHPWGWYKLSKPIRVHGGVNRILGMENEVVITAPLVDAVGESLFVFENLTSPAVVIEGFFCLGKGGGRQFYLVDNRTDKALVFRNLAVGAGKPRKPGKPGSRFFLEDVSGRITLEVGAGELCWLRQFNPEMPEKPMAVVDGGQLWILGLKTEGRATHVIARNQARVEVLGGISYQSWTGQKFDPPMFQISDSAFSATLPIHAREQPFSVIVEETIGDETRKLPRKDASRCLPLYRSGKAP